MAFLDSAMPHPRLGRFSCVAADPFGCFSVNNGRAAWNREPLDDPPLAALRRLLAAHARPRRRDLPPFQGGAIGTLSYDFGQVLEPMPRSPAPPWGSFPDVWLPFYDTVLAFDHANRRAHLIGASPMRADAFRERLAAPGPPPVANPVVDRELWRSNFSRDTYRAAVAAVIEAILAGEIFQANVAQRFLAEMPQGFEPWSFYRGLRRTNPAPFATFLDQGARTLASSSPELFLTLDGDAVETRPIKGTARRDPDPERDRAAAAALAASVKDRAENTMIVDLLRNDLSRVCRPGSVEVPALCEIESYAGVHHLVSAVTGRLRPGMASTDLLGACFPGGSVTGAPKPQAMRVIARTEGEARGVYCGSVACLGFDGAMTASVAIRTVTFQGGLAAFQAGGGITALSDPEAEYQETFAKAARIFDAFALRSMAP